MPQPTILPAPPVDPVAKRKVIQVAVSLTSVPAPFAPGILVVALCSDGSVWGTSARNTGWEQWTPPPGCE